MFPEALRSRESGGCGVALPLQVAILKILAARADGEAPVFSLARNLSIF